jgi:plasmid stabilization system protein ParE
LLWKWWNAFDSLDELARALRCGADVRAGIEQPADFCRIEKRRHARFFRQQMRERIFIAAADGFPRLH